MSDFHPKGDTTRAYGLWNEERGASNRAVIIIDKEGVIRFRETYQPGVLPDPSAIFDVLQGLD